MPDFDFALSIALGLGLAAAAGFRVFLPLLVLSVASHSGHFPLSDGFAWLSTTGALVMLTVAAFAEVLAYYIPGIDNLLDSLATPGAVAAGVALSAAVMVDMPPMTKWTLAIIAGGGAAAATQSATVFLRAHSTALTAGIGNPIIATAELVGALVLSLLSLIAPFVALALLGAFCLFAIHNIRNWRSRKRPD